jgi:peptidyl-prolyl cis-trans isomerase C
VKKDITFAVIAVIAVAAITYGLGSMRPNYTPTPSTPFSTTTGHKTTTKENIVMRVNGDPVSDREFMLYLEAAPEEMRGFYSSPQGRRLLAQEIVKVKALEQEAERLGLADDPDARVRLSIDRSNVLAGLALRKLVTTPDEKRIQEAYAKDRSKFETMEVSHIAIAYQGGQMPARTGQPLPRGQAMARAQAIEARLKAGADFATLARAESDDVRSGQNGGLIGPMSPTQLGPQLGQMLKKLKPGELSQPVETPFAIHIFKVGESKLQPLQQEMKEMLATQIQREEAEAAVDRLQKSAKVELDPKFFPPQKAEPRIPGRG